MATTQDQTPPETPEKTTGKAGTPDPTTTQAPDQAGELLAPLLEALRKIAKKDETPLEAFERRCAEIEKKAFEAGTKQGIEKATEAVIVSASDKFDGLPVVRDDGLVWCSTEGSFKYKQEFPAEGLIGWRPEDVLVNISSMVKDAVKRMGTGETCENLPPFAVDSKITLTIHVETPSLDA